MSVHEMTAAMYYLLARRRGERGAHPNGEHEAHASCPVVSDEELAFLRRYITKSWQKKCLKATSIGR